MIHVHQNIVLSDTIDHETRQRRHEERYGRYGVHHHASTYEEGVLRGAADLVRARGEFNLNSSAAAINYQEAYRRHLLNKQLKVDTFFAMRAANKAARFPQKDPAAEQARREASGESTLTAKSCTPALEMRS